MAPQSPRVPNSSTITWSVSRSVIVPSKSQAMSRLSTLRGYQALPGPRGHTIARMSAPRPILIHGSGGEHRVWEPVGARLAGSVALDLPGHPDGEPLRDVGAIGLAMAAALEQVPAPRVLVGHSLGGAAALEVACTRPELVDGLVVVASGARLPVPDHAMARVREDFGAERDRLLAGFAGRPGRRRRPARPARPSTPAGPTCSSPTTRPAGRSSSAAASAACGVPVLVVAGGDDPLTPPWLSEELARELPHAHMVVIPGARHLPMADVRRHPLGPGRRVPRPAGADPPGRMSRARRAGREPGGDEGLAGAARARSPARWPRTAWSGRS